jgi:hypothetical protein
VDTKLQEITTRLPGRVAPAPATYDSAAHLAEAVRRAAAANGKHGEETGPADPDGPDRYRQYMVDDRTAGATGA